MNCNIPRFKCFVRDSYLHQLDSRTSMTPGVAFALASIPGRSIGFHVLLNNGAQIGRLPPSAITTKKYSVERPTHHLQLWNCFSYEVSVIEYDFIQGMRASLALRSGEIVGGSYLFTIDWHGTQDAEDVGDIGWKCGHVIELDDGNIAIQPNNRIRWADASFVDLSASWPPDYKTIDYTMRCEQHGRWQITTDDMFFETREEHPPSKEAGE